MKYIVTLNGKRYEVEVEDAQATLLQVTDATNPAQPAPTPAPAPEPTPTPTPAPTPAPAPTSAPSQPQAAGEAVKAPMPGTIVSVKVSQGEAVAKGQVLVVLEAMKMENEISSPRAGTVAQILVSQGSSVQTDATLLILS